MESLIRLAAAAVAIAILVGMFAWAVALPISLTAHLLGWL